MIVLWVVTLIVGGLAVLAGFGRALTERSNPAWNPMEGVWVGIVGVLLILIAIGGMR